MNNIPSVVLSYRVIPELSLLFHCSTFARSWETPQAACRSSCVRLKAVQCTSVMRTFFKYTVDPSFSLLFLKKTTQTTVLLFFPVRSCSHSPGVSWQSPRTSESSPPSLDGKSSRRRVRPCATRPATRSAKAPGRTALSPVLQRWRCQ